MKLIDAEKRPRYERGVDHGGEALVILRQREVPGVRLVWCYSFKGWRDMMSGYVHYAATLSIEAPRSIGGVCIHEGGRLSRGLLTDPNTVAAVAAAFELSEDEALRYLSSWKRGKTVVVKRGR